MPAYDQFSLLLLHIHRAGAASDSWECALGQIARYLRGTAAALVLHDFRLARGEILRVIGCDPVYVRRYAQGYAAKNVWLQDERHYRAAGMLAVGHELVPAAEFAASPFYMEWLEPQNLHHRMGAVVWHHDHAALLLEVMGPPDRPPFGASEVGRLRRLLPHLQQAYQLHRHLMQTSAELACARHVLDALPAGVLLVDEHGAVLLANRRADAMLTAADGVGIHGGRLVAASAVETGKLLSAVAGAAPMANGKPTRSSRAMTLSRRSGGRSLHVRVVPLRDADRRLGEQPAAAVVFVVDPELPIEFDEGIIGELFGLTRVEARLASLIAQGRSMEEAASSLSIQVNTARCNLKRIFAKTGVHRQSELVRLLLQGLGG